MHFKGGNIAQLSDEELFELVATSSNHEAYERLFERYYADLIRYTYSRVGEFYLAEDIVQEVLMSIWRRRKSVIVPKTVKAYFFQAIKYKIADEISKIKYGKEYLESLEIPITANTDFKVRESMLQAKIDQEIEKLPKRMKEVFILSRKENMSHQEIADHLGLSVHTVSTQIKKTLKLLRSRLLSFILFLF